MECWGSNDDGQLDPPQREETVESGPFASISANGNHTCGLQTDGQVVCWGDDEFGQVTAPEGRFQSVSAGGAPQLWCGSERLGGVLGLEPLRPERISAGELHVGERRQRPHLRDQGGRHSGMLGLERLRAKSPAAGDIHVDQQRRIPFVWGQGQRFCRVLGRR